MPHIQRLALPLLLLLAACPESDPGDPDPDRDAGVPADAGTARDGGAEEESVGDRLARIVCEREMECCPGNASDCRILGSLLDGRLTGPGIALDQAGYDACVAKMQNATCAEVAEYGGRLPVARYCGPMTRPTLANGETCRGLFADLSCESGRCGPDDTCAPLAAENETCLPGECAAGLKCGVGTCHVPTAANESCELTNVCVDGYECYRDDPNDDARCHPITIIEPGVMCGDGLECRLGPEECRCPRGSTGCSVGVCGSATYCQP